MSRKFLNVNSEYIIIEYYCVDVFCNLLCLIRNIFFQRVNERLLWLR